MYSNIKLRALFLPFLIIGLIPFYGLLKLNIDFNQLESLLVIIVIKYLSGALIAVLGVFFYLKLSGNNYDPKWVTVFGTVSMYLFCFFSSSLIGPLFFLGYLFMGIILGMKIYELEFRESVFIGIIFLMSHLASIAIALALRY